MATCLGSLDLSPPFNQSWLSGVNETEKSNDRQRVKKILL